MGPRGLAPPPGGVTLLECLVVIAIAGILAAAGAPSLGRTLAASAVAAQARELAAALRFARAEAVRRGGLVSVCARDGATEPPTCAGTTGGWDAGWLVFADVDGDVGRLGPADQVLRVQPALSRSGGVEATTSSLTYGPAGIAVEASSHFLFRPVGRGASVQLVCVARTGRPRLAPAGQSAC